MSNWGQFLAVNAYHNDYVQVLNNLSINTSTVPEHFKYLRQSINELPYWEKFQGCERDNRINCQIGSAQRFVKLELVF